MSRGLLGQDHVLRDLLAHHGERLDADGLAGFELWLWNGGSHLGSGGRGPCTFRLLEKIEDVVLGDPTGDSRALDLGDVDVVFASNFTNKRRRLRPTPFVDGGDVRGPRLAVRGARRRCHGGRLLLDLLFHRFVGDLLFRLRCSGGRHGRRAPGGGRPYTFSCDSSDDGVHGDSLPFLHQDLGQCSRGRGGNLRVHFVGGDLEQRFVTLHLLAGLLDPAHYRPLADRLPHLRHDDINGNWFLAQYASSSRAAAITLSRFGRT